MKIIVDEMPKEPKECLFVEDHRENMLCGLNVSQPCNPKECKYLKEEHKNIIFDIEGE